jgi:hypothetical protein
MPKQLRWRLARNHPESHHRRPGWQAISTLVGLGCCLLLGACAYAKASATSGARGLVAVHLWDEQGTKPITVLARSVRQQGQGFEHLELDSALMRIPGEHGVLYVLSPRAVYSSGAQDTIVLDDPVRFAGTWQGQPLMGRATSAAFNQAEKSIRLTDVELLFEGAHRATPWVKAEENRPLAFGPLPSPPPPPCPAVAAALALLPRPFVLPELSREDYGVLDR